jgi:hypothetical protein
MLVMTLQYYDIISRGGNKSPSLRERTEWSPEIPDCRQASYSPGDKG